MPAMCITHKITGLHQYIYANGSRKLFCFRVGQFSGLKYYFTQEITPFRNLFSVCPGFWNLGGPVQVDFTVLSIMHYPYKYCSGQSVPDTVAHIMHYPYKYCSRQSVPDTISNIMHYPYKYCIGQSVPDTVSNISILQFVSCFH